MAWYLGVVSTFDLRQYHLYFCAHIMFSRKRRLPSPFSSQDEEYHHASEEASFD